MLVVVCGAPGVGKSTVARRIADRVGARVLRTDLVRKELAPDPEYTSDETREVYRTILDRTNDLLGEESVVLDGTFRRQRYRKRARDIAAAADVEFEVVKVECERDVVEDRITAREDDPSDADFDVHLLVREEFEPVSLPHVTVDNSNGLADTRRQVESQF